MLEDDKTDKSPIERFEELGRKLFQVPKEQIEAEPEPEEPTEGEEPGEADS
jgi:hypothetical protein